MKPRVKGYLLVIAAAALYGCYPIISKFALSNGASAPLLLILKSCGLISYGLMGFLNPKVDMRPKGHPLWKIALLSLFGAVLTPLLLLSSYTFIPSGTATTVHYLYCVFTLVICVVIYHEKLDWIKAACVVMCMAGVALLYSPSLEGSAIGLGLAFASAITFALYAVYLDKSGLHDMQPVKLQFYLLCFSTPITLLYGIFSGGLENIKMSAPAWGAACGYYLIGAAAAGLFFQRGVHLIGSERTAILSTIEPLTSVLLGVLLFSEELSLKSGLGVAAILAAAVLITSVDGLRSKKLDTSKLNSNKPS